MKIIHTSWFPPGKFAGIMLFGVLVVKGKESRLSPAFLNHELIHCAQAKDCGGWWRFYILYICQWICALFVHFNSAYHAIPFEREAYANAANLTYLDTRQPGTWKNYKDKNLKKRGK